MLKRLTKEDKAEINKMADIIRRTRYPNGYISPQVAAETLYRRGYKKQGDEAVSGIIKVKK